jgi:dinuclear metal center YbgI/SA1388 family protein
MSADLREISEYLDQYLVIGEVSDWEHALNGLQVENVGEVTRVGAAVDACQFTIDRSAAAHVDLLVVHHGLFWGGLEPITGRNARRIRALVAANLAVYSAHLPLDIHREVGNNILLAKLLGLEQIEPFGDFKGQPIGVAGNTSASREQLVVTLAEALEVSPHLIAAGSGDAGHVGVVTGGGGNYVRQAREAGIDTFVTGEGPHHSHFDAEEWGINLIYAGHYATETLGVKALASHVAEVFGLPWEFIDHPTGL